MDRRINKSFEIAGILVRKMLGKHLPEEEGELKEWLTDHDVREDEIVSWEGYQNRQKRMVDIDIEGEWESLQKKSNKKQTVTKRLRIQRALRYAAGIAIPIMVALGTYLLIDQVLLSTEEQVVEIPHGERKASLVLSDGKIVDLHPEQEADIREDNGATIKNDSVMLSYDTGKTNTKQVLKATVKPIYNELIVNRGMEYMLELNDGTKVWLNSLSKLRYPVVFGGQKRIVELSGEAYFEVAHDEQRPFIVKTKDCDIRVLGTSFNVTNYHDDDHVVTTLLKGKVQLEEIKGEGDMRLQLDPDQQFIYNRITQRAEVREVEASIYNTWTKGSFRFESEPLDEIMMKLSRWYDIDVVFQDAAAREELFSGKLPRFKEFHSIAALIEEISNVNFEITNKTIKISRK
ncbi:DUF4974 domain-containing protein [Puteibacter caeruleilacunae]|nr:DUF4974 domain-containing protein [Puteibacter caeruleilacunae]